MFARYVSPPITLGKPAAAAAKTASFVQASAPFRQ